MALWRARVQLTSALLLSLTGVARADLRLVEECALDQGICSGYGYILAFDSDHNGRGELLFQTKFRGSNRWGLAGYESAQERGFALVFMDTTSQGQQGIVPSLLLPYAVGYLDVDSLTDLIGTNGQTLGETLNLIVCQHEGLSRSSYPETLVWYGPYARNVAQSERVYLADLDQDGLCDVLLLKSGKVWVFENSGDNSCRLADTAEARGMLSRFAIGDFDADGRTEFASPSLTDDHVWFWECQGNDHYALVDYVLIGLSNGHDVFGGDDCDRSGRREFFVGFAEMQSFGWDMYLYQIEYNGTDYDTFRIATGTCGADWWWGRQSECGDIDGDSIAEVVWSLSTQAQIYKATGPHQYMQAGCWSNHGANDLSVNIADVNRDGYNEVICSGSNNTYVLGLEAARLKYPNGGEELRGLDTVSIRWQRFEPPRCDSVSLFFSIDNGATYDTIATSIAPSDTNYPWVVPDVRSDSCLVKAVVYGPGWRQDVSDAVLRILPSGIAEERGDPRRSFGLVVCPNPMSTETYLSFGPWRAGKSSLRIFDASGRLVRDLSTEAEGRGCLRWEREGYDGQVVPQGVYVVQFRSGGKSATRKVVVK